MRRKPITRNRIINLCHNGFKLPFSVCRRVLKEENWNLICCIFRLSAIRDGKESEGK